jgi:hypothetical protein
MSAAFLPDLDAPADGGPRHPDRPPRYGPAEQVMAPTKIKAEERLATGTLALPGAGLLQVTFDNSYSIFRSKTFDYRIRVRDSEDHRMARRPTRTG